jgi:phenylacetic acid degradation operon negative regulatory protein
MSKPALRKTSNKPPAHPAFAAASEQLVSTFAAQRPIRTGSLVTSVFGDAIAVHGGSIWLGSLIHALEGFGINQRLVRTSVFRLAKDGWLSSEQIGRRSYYRLTESGRHRFDEASRRIYAEPRHDWPGTWCLVLTGNLDTAERDAVRKELGWLGFAAFSPNVLAHPAPDMSAVEEHLDAIGCSDRVLVMESRLSDDRQRHTLRAQVHAAWSLDDLAERYRQFLEQFRPVYASARKRPGKLDPELCFQVRTLLIHEYRKIHLRDPMLPEALLPGRWDGIAAYQLCRNLYGLVAAPAEAFLTTRMETADGPLPPAEPRFYQRFGGLPTGRKR